MKKIQLSKGMVAFVDDEDFEWLSKYRWYAAKRPLAGSVQYYAMRHDPPNRKVLMHRQILGCSQEEKADHIDSNGLNNTRENLRIATSHENCRNKSWNPHSSKFKGVWWSKRREYWYSAIKVDYKAIHLGCFDEEIDAAIAYNNAALEHFGEFAKLNPIPEGWVFTPARIWSQDRIMKSKQPNYQT